MIGAPATIGMQSPAETSELRGARVSAEEGAELSAKNGARVRVCAEGGGRAGTKENCDMKLVKSSRSISGLVGGEGKEGN